MTSIKSIIRRVRTPAGVRWFNKPIGSIITRADYERVRRERARAPRQSTRTPKTRQRRSGGIADVLTAAAPRSKSTGSRQRWTKSPYQVAIKSGSDPDEAKRDGFTAGRWAMSKRGSGGYDVTHLPSGLRMPSPNIDTKRRIDAERFVHAIDSMFHDDGFDYDKKEFIKEKGKSGWKSGDLVIAAMRLAEAGGTADGKRVAFHPSLPSDIADAKHIYKEITGEDWTPDAYKGGVHAWNGTPDIVDYGKPAKPKAKTPEPLPPPKPKKETLPHGLKRVGTNGAIAGVIDHRFGVSMTKKETGGYHVIVTGKTNGLSQTLESGDFLRESDAIEFIDKVGTRVQVNFPPGSEEFRRDMYGGFSRDINSLNYKDGYAGVKFDHRTGLWNWKVTRNNPGANYYGGEMYDAETGSSPDPAKAFADAWAAAVGPASDEKTKWDYIKPWSATEPDVKAPPVKTKPSKSMLKDLDAAQQFIEGGFDQWQADARDPDEPVIVRGDQMMGMLTLGRDSALASLQKTSYSDYEYAQHQARVIELNKSIAALENVMDSGQMPSNTELEAMGLGSYTHMNLFAEAPPTFERDAQNRFIPPAYFNEQLDYMLELGTNMDNEIQNGIDDDPEYKRLTDRFHALEELRTSKKPPSLGAYINSGSTYGATHAERMAAYEKDFKAWYGPAVKAMKLHSVPFKKGSLKGAAPNEFGNDYLNSVYEAKKATQKAIAKRERDHKIAYMSVIRPVGLGKPGSTQDSATPEFKEGVASGASQFGVPVGVGTSKLTEDAWDGMMREGLSVYPTTWINALAEKTPKMRKNFAGRASVMYIPGVGDQNNEDSAWVGVPMSDDYGQINLGHPEETDESTKLYAGAFDSYADQVAMHEFGHMMEGVIPGVAALEWTLHYRRTKGEKAKDLGGAMRGEFAYEDQFSNPYAGKAYIGDGANGDHAARTRPHQQNWELFTTSMEDVYGGGRLQKKYTTRDDREIEQLILAMMATLHVAIDDKGKTIEKEVWK